jgi:NAD(P)-dependent dehydrogenase (short-subunit alcohol dehydrogenase family)
MDAVPIWLVTGCAHGIGREVALAALQSGAKVIAADIDVPKVQEFASLHPDRCFAIRLDLADNQTIAETVAAAVARFGVPDVLVNNAAISFFGAVEETPETEIRKIFEVNFHGPSTLARALLPAMRARGSGTIVNISSLGGVIGHANAGYYSASKFALEGFSEALRAEIEPFGLRVIVVEPGGGFRTGMMSRTRVTPTPLPEYQRTLAPVIKRSNEAIGHEPGDPVRAAAAVLAAVNDRCAARRLLLGSVAFDKAMAHLDAVQAEYRSHEALSRSTDFPAVAAAISGPIAHQVLEH